MGDQEYGGFQYCQNCGHEHLVYTKKELEELESKVEWDESGNALCPKCKHPNDFGDFFDGK